MNIGAILIEIVLPAVLTVAVLFVNGLLDRQPQAFPPMARDPLHSAGPSHRRKLASLVASRFRRERGEMASAGR